MSKKRDIDVSSEAGLIWKIANDVLRDIFQRTEYPDIIYPMVLIRRLECVLENEKNKIFEKLGDKKDKFSDKMLSDKINSKIGFNNTSGMTLQGIKDEGEETCKTNFTAYLNGFQSKRKKKQTINEKGEKEDVFINQIGEVINNSGIRKQIAKLAKSKILFSLIEEFANVDLMPDSVSNIKMGYIFEELIRRFSEANNAEAGEHYTPREVIDLMVNLLGIEERALKTGELISIYDPACGTGGMLTACKEFIEATGNAKAEIQIFGQEVSDKTWSVCEADLMIKGEKKAEVVLGDTLTNDGFSNKKFDFMLSNPPYGKAWRKIKKTVLANSKGRFNIGQPRTSDGQLLFTLHMLDKMKKSEKGGSSIAIVHNGSPLFSGDAGSGESKIREYVIANDWLDTIVALPTDLFYNTGIATYVWLIRNNKPKTRKGKIQLINAVDFWEPMKRSLGKKRRRISDANVQRIVQLHKDFKSNEHSKIFDLDDFAFRKVYLDLEEQDENGKPVFEDKTINIPQGKIKEFCKVDTKKLKTILDKKDTTTTEFDLELKAKSELIEKYKTPDTHITLNKAVIGNRIKFETTIEVPVIIKDTESIPWKTDHETWLQKEVEKPWTITAIKKGYEIPFTREFYVYQPLRKLAEPTAEFAKLEQENQALLNQLGLNLMYETV